MGRWDDDAPREKFRLRPKHALVLVDLAVLAIIFVITGQIYVKTQGVKAVLAKQKAQQAAQVANAGLIAQADSVLAAARVTLDETTREHDETISTVRRMSDDLKAGIVSREQLEQGIFRLSDMVLDLRERTEKAVSSVERYKEDVGSRGTEIDSLDQKANTTLSRLTQIRQEHEATIEELARARQREAFDPRGHFPERTGVAVRQDLGTDLNLTNLELQRILWKPGAMAVGVSMGVGLGTEQSVSNKELGLLLTQNLIHRRLGLDVAGGYSILTRSQGDEEAGAYASAGLRLSPFYRQRLHLGLGARAAHGEVLPFIGVTVGRR